MCQYPNVRGAIEDTTATTVGDWRCATPPSTAKTAVPSAPQMSTPKWNDLCAASGIRGSFRYPRTGCCRSNGFSGQPYEPPVSLGRTGGT